MCFHVIFLCPYYIVCKLVINVGLIVNKWLINRKPTFCYLLALAVLSCALIVPASPVSLLSTNKCRSQSEGIKRLRGFQVSLHQCEQLAGMTPEHAQPVGICLIAKGSSEWAETLAISGRSCQGGMLWGLWSIPTAESWLIGNTQGCRLAAFSRTVQYDATGL